MVITINETLEGLIMTRTPTKIFKGKIYGSQLVGKPKDRWIHDVTSEARKILGITGYKRLALEGKMWVRRLILKSLLLFCCHNRCCCCGGGGSGSIGSSNSRSSSKQACCNFNSN